MAQSVFPAKSNIPSGNTASRPSAPSTGDTFYNGQLAVLEIYNGTSWVPLNAKPETPSIVATDVATNVAYGSAKASVAFTANTTGGSISNYNVYSSTGGYTEFATSNPAVITVGNNGSYTFTGTVHNAYGISPVSASSTVTLTTLPETPSNVVAAISTTSTDITVSWTIGNNGGKAISALKLVPYLNGTTAQTEINLSTTATSTVITGLTSGSVYTYRVYTTNANGNSALSTASNSITVPTFFAINYLVLAGGGGGGGVSNGAGGGAGGLRSTYSATGGGGSPESTITVPKGSVPITVTVGAGGGTRSNGAASVFSSITAAGGGGGGRNSGTIGPPAQYGSSGGSGGGGASQSGASGTTNQGFAGGSGSGRGGGGGGAGGAGNNNGTGGLGISNNITGSSLSIGGGGGGGGTPGGVAYAGGGAGVENATANNGTANTGGGGGGRNSGPDTDNGASGGSGIVILRWPTATATITIGAGLTGSTTTTGSDSVATITAGTGNVSWA